MTTISLKKLLVQQKIKITCSKNEFFIKIVVIASKTVDEVLNLR